MKRWTNGLPGATKRLGAMMALRGLSLSQPRMRADTHDGPEQIAPLQRPDTLMQLSRSLSWKSILYRTAGPYILAQSGHASFVAQCPLLGVKPDIRVNLLGAKGSSRTGALAADLVQGVQRARLTCEQLTTVDLLWVCM
jgi:hypothetical protein